MNINIGKLIKKNKIILYLVIIIGSLLIFKHIRKNNTIEGYQNKVFGADKPKSYSNPDGNLKWTAYKICIDESDNIDIKAIQDSCTQGYFEQKKINYGWVDGSSEKWKKIEWEYNKYKNNNFHYLEKFKDSISKQNNTKWLSIINDDKFVSNDPTNKISKLKQLNKEWDRITAIWGNDINDKLNKDNYSYHEKLWNLYPKQPRNMSPYDLLDKYIKGEINESSKIIRIGYYQGNNIIKNNYDNNYPLQYFQKQHSTDTGLFPWLKSKLYEKRDLQESKYFWFKNGNSNWNGPYDKYQLLKQYKSGNFNDKSYIVRSTGNNKTLSKLDKSKPIQFYKLGQNLASDNSNNRLSFENEAWNPKGVTEKDNIFSNNDDLSGFYVDEYDLYDWIQQNKSTKEDGSWPMHRPPGERVQNAWTLDTNSYVYWTNNETGEKMRPPYGNHPSQRKYETITDLNHPLYGAIKNITKEECINTEAVDKYGETKKNFGTCNKSTYPYGDACYFKKTFWGFEDKGICYPLSCKGEYNPNKRCRTKYKNSAIPKCLQENNLECTQGQTEFNAFGITPGGNFDQVSYKKKFTVNGKRTNKDKPYNEKNTKCSCVCKPGWTGDKCDIPVSWENKCQGATDAASCKREVPEVKNVVKEQLSILEMVLITIAVLTVVILFLFFLFYKKGDHTIDNAFKKLHTNVKNIGTKIPINNPRLNKAFAKV